MIVTPLRTRVVTPSSLSLHDLLAEAVSELHEGDIVVIASKVVALCEGSVVERGTATKDELIAREASAYLLPEHSRYGHHFTVTNYTLIASAGIDESNSDNQFVLWPRNPQQTARDVRTQLAARFGLQDLGVIITDSTCQPLRRGTSGIALAHAGFQGIKDYIGTPDLFGHKYQVTYSNVSGGLAAAAVVAMGEGTEQTPIVRLQDLPFVRFDAAAPDAAELKTMQIGLDEDLFAPFLQAVDWQHGEGRATPQ